MTLGAFLETLTWPSLWRKRTDFLKSISYNINVFTKYLATYFENKISLSKGYSLLSQVKTKLFPVKKTLLKINLLHWMFFIMLWHPTARFQLGSWPEKLVISLTYFYIFSCQKLGEQTNLTPKTLERDTTIHCSAEWEKKTIKNTLFLVFGYNGMQHTLMI